MEFSIGNIVVYPHHGAARIENIIERGFNGETVQYLVLQTLQSNLNIQVPVKSARLTGVRDVVGEKGLLKVFSIPRETDVEETGNWSRHCGANQEHLGLGDIDEVAEIVHGLRHHDQDRGLSASEKRILNKARQILIGELALADGVGEVEVEEVFTHADATIEHHYALMQGGAASEEKDETDDGPADPDTDT